MLELRVEWLEAPGVTSNVLAETWAQLAIVATDIDGQRHVLSRLIWYRPAACDKGVYLATGRVTRLCRRVVGPGRRPTIRVERRRQSRTCADDCFSVRCEHEGH